jgi:hypothetical protein
MTRFTLTVAAVLLLASVSAAGGQTPAGAPAQPPAGPLLVPRVDLGGSLGLGVGWVSDEPGAAAIFLPGGRVGVALNRRWALEGVFDVMAGDNDLAVIYRAQARWLFRGAAAPGGLQPHLTFGGTGGFERDTWGPFEWRDAAGVLHREPRQSDWNFMPPILPTIGIGVQKTLGAHFALRTDLAAIFVPADDFVGVLLMPSVSLSIPIGRYPVRSW